MDTAAVLHPCVLCAEASGAMRPARSRCPRCWRWLCAEHLPGHAPAPWPGRLSGHIADGPPDHLADHLAGRPAEHSASAVPARPPVVGHACTSCAARAPGSPPPMRLTTRMAVVSAVSVLGMLAGALSVLLLAMAVGLGGELTVFCMLVAEVAGGALAGRHAERRVDAWLAARARVRCVRGLPRARLLAGPGRREP